MLVLNAQQLFFFFQNCLEIYIRVETNNNSKKKHFKSFDVFINLLLNYLQNPLLEYQFWLSDLREILVIWDNCYWWIKCILIAQIAIHSIAFSII